MTLEISNVVKNPDGSIEIETREGPAFSFASWEDVKFYANSVTEAEVIRFALGKWIYVEPNGDNPNYLKGKAITVSPSDNTPVAIR